MVEGADLAGARVIWDAGNSNKHIPGGFLGAYMFSVPPDAVPGQTYNVALENESGRRSTTSIPFHVEAREAPLTSFLQPRIDSVTLLGTDFNATGVATAIYVQGANFDVGAVVRVNDVDVATASHKGLRGERYKLPAKDFGYPIYHYVSSIALAGRHRADTTINITVRNLDGQVSAPFTYRLPADLASVDSDGDSLLDTWEINGYDPNHDGVLEVDLPALGADPFRRDLLLEVDVMEGLDNPPDQFVFDEAHRMFANAPTLNPATSQGINLIVDATQAPCLVNASGVRRCQFPHVFFDVDNASLPPPPDPFPSGVAYFSQLKKENFGNAERGAIYHYAIWANADNSNPHRSGQSDLADDFVVSFDDFAATNQTPRSKIEMLVHELGHDLGLRHGGEDDVWNTLPNYWSVMGYNWLRRTGWWSSIEGKPDDGKRARQVTCLPFYYGQANADEPHGEVLQPVTTNVDYSEGMGPTFDPARPPPPTMCGKTVDWNVFVLTFPDAPLKDFADWRALKFDGPGLNQRPSDPGITP